ncbi:protease inhibitor I42 family protein [Streptomyces sp. NBC_00335]|uniref:protease inhibitor I42 family protein n=1 Tax=unclassified Streptomyces TaxID=2593676 RepID=UPI0022541038|nr:MULTISPECIES: protease inhibitor I42 family protein [unclassified Streptomyces]MCX5405883.1 protease inhibitor I42 family protein [Streptomyces sp. NBC_00086]
MEVREVVLAPGEQYELRLTGRGARGYVWTWRVTGDADAVSVAEGAPETAAAAAGAPDPPEPPEPLPGATVERVYLVRGRVAGRARIRFAQVRPAYPDEAAYDEFVLDVMVR